MKRTLIATVALLLGFVAEGQRYSFTFRPEGCADTVLYIALHHRDALVVADSARRGANGTYVFKGRRAWQRGIYALVGQDRKRLLTDFCIDGSRNFRIDGDAKLSAGSVRVKGCTANAQMYSYLAVEQAAMRELDSIEARKKVASTREAAEREEAALMQRMETYEQMATHPAGANIYFELMHACEVGEMPDTVADKAAWFRRHYWDNLFSHDSGLRNPDFKGSKFALLHSPQLFNKVNYYFFGLPLYYAESDTVCAAIDRLAELIGDDTALLRYVLDHIEPRYFRSSARNVGWDAVWCHLMEGYYLAGRCPWASESALHNMRYNYSRIRQSIIGAHGQELWMLDTTQIDSPEHWRSSHRFPTRYVVLWFWDPDCHHCQEQSEELKKLYDGMLEKGEMRFEVYAVGYEADVEKWRRYVREHDFRWTNVGGTNVNIDYQEAYNVHGAPTMIILDERRDIIMNKVLPAGSLMQFLDNHEKKQTAGSR